MRRSPVRSTIVIATARNASNHPPATDVGTGLALSYSPLSPEEGTSTTLQKPVAIKRIAPALASDPQLVASFLDTARFVTGLRHPNVAQIHEVGQVGSDVFLVMDYLMGETVATLMRKLHSRGETLDGMLAAHIIAEASAGLEAAHELGILHEQLTPRDLFVGYDGSVRVLDIGIAAARSRLAGERDGGRLELEYTSPERCRQEPLDRRSDVFSLGTMLWELNTGISPFERVREADTVRAICEEPMIPPGHAMPGLPEEVSAITMEALARDRDYRYADARSLRQALLGVVRGLGPAESAADELSKLMNLLFETRVRDKREMLRRIDLGGSIATLDIGEVEEPGAAPAPAPARVPSQAPRIDPDEPSVVIAPASNPVLPVAVTAPPPAPPPAEATDSRRPQARTSLVPGRTPPRNVRVLVWGVTLLLVLGGTLLGAIALQRGKVQQPPAALKTSAPSAVALPATTAPLPTEVPEPPGSGTAEAPEETVLNIETVPAHATILIAGAKKGVSPIELRMPKSRDPITVEIRHVGYQTMKEKVVPDVNQRLKLTLVASRDPVAPAGSAPYRKFE